MRTSPNIFYVGDVIKQQQITNYYRRGDGKEMLTLQGIANFQKAQLSFRQVKHLEGMRIG